MRIGTLAAGLAVAGVLGVAAGCSHEQHAAGTVPNTMSLAQGDKVGRTLLVPAGRQAEVADTRAESAPWD